LIQCSCEVSVAADLFYFFRQARVLSCPPNSQAFWLDVLLGLLINRLPPFYSKLMYWMSPLDIILEFLAVIKEKSLFTLGRSYSRHITSLMTQERA